MTYIYPDFFARFYDLIYHQLRDDIDTRFFQDKISATHGKILEIGTGTGRLFAEALTQGTDIFGIDVSPAMLDILKSKIPANQSFRISEQNMIDFQFDDKFDLIIAPFRVFMHITDKTEQIKAINNVHKYLNPGGKFIFDTFIPDLNQLIKGLDNHLDFEGEYSPGKKVKRIVSTKPDFINQLIHVTFKFEWDQDNNNYSGIWETSLRFFFRYELEHLMERSDFKSDFNIYGDYQLNPLNQNSKEFIITCHKSD